MRHKWIIACMSLTLCAPLGVLASYAPRPWPSLELPSRDFKARNFVRIELPPVRIVEADLTTDLDAAVMLREAIEATELPATEDGSKLAIAPDPVALTPAEQDRLANVQPTGRPDGLLEVSFDLSQPDMLGDSSLDVRKVVRFNGMDAGRATIRVGAGSALFIASEDLRSLLSAAERVDIANRLAERPFVGFDEVRQAGLNLQYDAASDRILISG